jgi:hypothetical protein
MRGRKKYFMIDPFQIIRLFMGRAEGEGPWQQGFFCLLRPFGQPKYNKKIPTEYMGGSWAVCKMLNAMVPERPTPVKMHSSNFVYMEHIKRTQSDWKTQNNSEWNWNLTTNFQVHAKEKTFLFLPSPHVSRKENLFSICPTLEVNSDSQVSLYRWLRFNTPNQLCFFTWWIFATWWQKDIREKYSSFEETISELGLFDKVPTSHQNIAEFLSFSTFLSNL